MSCGLDGRVHVVEAAAQTVLEGRPLRGRCFRCYGRRVDVDQSVGIGADVAFPSILLCFLSWYRCCYFSSIAWHDQGYDCGVKEGRKMDG